MLNKITIKDINDLAVEQVDKILAKQLSHTEIQEIENKLPKEIPKEELENLSENELENIINILSGLQKHFIGYLKIGGFPELALTSDDKYSARILREDIVDSAIRNAVLMKDDIITKEQMDYGITELENGKKIVRISAFAFLYLLGRQE